MCIYSNEGSSPTVEDLKAAIDHIRDRRGKPLRLQRRDFAICHPDRVDEVKEMIRLVYGSDPDEAA